MTFLGPALVLFLKRLVVFSYKIILFDGVKRSHGSIEGNWPQDVAYAVGMDAKAIGVEVNVILGAVENLRIAHGR